MVRKHLDAGYSLSAETDKMYRDLARQPWPDALDKSISD
jgi:hypothetical protein